MSDAFSGKNVLITGSSYGIGAATGLGRWQRDTVRSFTQAMAAYWTDEQPLVAAKANVERFVREVDSLRDDVARLEKRFEQWLQKKAGR